MGGRHKDLEYHKKWWEKNKHKYSYPRSHTDPEYHEKYYKGKKEVILSRQKTLRESNPQKRLYNSVKYSAKKRNLAFDIEIDDIVIPNSCPILGVPFERFTEYTPSVDRIDNSKGYIKGNIQVISKKANVMKSSANIQELLNFSEWVTKNYKPVNIEDLLCVS